jgi:hypothetical protein
MSENLEEVIMDLIKYHITVLKKEIKDGDVSYIDLIDWDVKHMMIIQYEITASFMKSEIKEMRKDLEKKYEEKLNNIQNEGNK